MEALTTAQLWVVIVTSSVVVLALATTFYFRGGSIQGARTGGIYIPEKTKREDPAFMAALQCVYSHLPGLRKMKRQVYWKALRQQGVEKEHLTAHEDAMYYDQCLGNIIFSGNGIQSFRTILEMELSLGKHKETRRDNEMNRYIEDLSDRLQTEADRYLDNWYRTMVVTDHGEIRQRLVSREHLFELEREQIGDFRDFLKDIFSSINSLGCKD